MTVSFPLPVICRAKCCNEFIGEWTRSHNWLREYDDETEYCVVEHRARCESCGTDYAAHATFYPHSPRA